MLKFLLLSLHLLTFFNDSNTSKTKCLTYEHTSKLHQNDARDAFISPIKIPENKITEHGLNSSDISTIVGEHNKYRISIAKGQVPNQPRGTNLKRMKWDTNLAKSAQEIANTCQFRHVTVTDGRWPAVGQNLALHKSTDYKNGSDWVKVMKDWFDENKRYRFPNISPETGHYTQIIWATTEYIGCGYTFYSTNGTSYSYKFQKLYVCNYGPAGNYIKQAPYKVGTKGCENLC